MDAPAPRYRRRRPRPAALAAVVVAACLLLPTADAFAAWFVDRKVSCFTDLAPGEIVMNNGVLSHSESREPGIRIDVAAVKEDNGAPGTEYTVQFVVPEVEKSRVPDAQYVVELSSSEEDEVPAKFTAPAPGGGIGCDGKRTHGKAAEGEGSVFTINADAPKGTRIDITAGWATGHEAVSLTESVFLVVGDGIIGRGYLGNDGDAADDALEDDEAEEELEESFIEEEREYLEEEIEEAEEDAVEALEEKRIENDGKGAEELNEAEEEIVEALEENRIEVNQALNELKDEIETKKRAGLAEHQHKHKMLERQEAEARHRQEHDKRRTETRLEEMRRRFENVADARKEKLEHLIDKKAALQDNLDKLEQMDNREHDAARRRHIDRLPREELRVDMEELKHKAQEKLHLLSDKLGVHELMNEPHVRAIRGQLKKGNFRGGEGTFHGEAGQPLPPEGRHFLVVFFSLFGLVGLVRWGLEKRRRAKKKDFRRSL
ncbi:hypothetical protein ACHAXT_007591 [Thalassiosira profunda]